MTPKTQPLPSILHCCSCLATLSLFAAVLLAANDDVEASPTGFASRSQGEALASLSSAVARSEPTEPLVRKRRQFLSCWGGWAPSCTGGTLWAELRSYRNQLRPRPVPRVEERHKTGGGGARRTSGRRTDGIPSIVTSGESVKTLIWHCNI